MNKMSSILLFLPVAALASLISLDEEYLGKLRLDMEIKEAPDIHFNKIVDIGSDPKANIYVLDSKEKTIYIFNEGGKYLRRIGRPGQGPGELEKPCSLYIDPRGNVYVLDDGNRRIEVFDNESHYLKSIKVSVFPEGSQKRIAVNHKGNIIITGRFRDEKSRFPIATYSPEGEFIKTIPLPLIEYDAVKFNDRDKERASEYLSGGSVCVDKNDIVFFSHSWPYVIDRVSNDDGSVRIKRKTGFNWIPVIFKTDRMNGMLFGDFTRSKKIFLWGDFIVNAISVYDWEGNPRKEIQSRKFAANPEKYIKLKERYCVLDIFSNELKYIASGRIDGNINILASDGKGRLLGVRQDDNGMQSIERYSLMISNRPSEKERNSDDRREE